jgi:hypothetical protein
MQMHRLRVIAAGALAALLISGCGGNEVIQPTVNVSLGQQLIDLKKARDSNALSERDYEREKKKLIDDAR